MKLPERITFVGTEDPAPVLIRIFLNYGIPIVVGGSQLLEKIQNSIRGMEPEENLLWTDPAQATVGANIIFVCQPPAQIPGTLAGLPTDALAILCTERLPDVLELRSATGACLVRAFHHLQPDLLTNPLSFGQRISHLYCCDRPSGRARVEQLLDLCALEPIFSGNLDLAHELENVQQLLVSLEIEHGPLALKLLRGQEG